MKRITNGSDTERKAVKPARARYVEIRNNGTDPVGSLGARRISQEIRNWIASEARRSKRTQRAVIEDCLEAFIRHRERHTGRYPYENLPRDSGTTFRAFIRLDLLQNVLDIIQRDGIFNGDFVNAAIKFDMDKDNSNA